MLLLMYLYLVAQGKNTEATFTLQVLMPKKRLLSDICIWTINLAKQLKVDVVTRKS